MKKTGNEKLEFSIVGEGLLVHEIWRQDADTDAVLAALAVTQSVSSVMLRSQIGIGARARLGAFWSGVPINALPLMVSRPRPF